MLSHNSQPQRFPPRVKGLGFIGFRNRVEGNLGTIRVNISESSGSLVGAAVPGVGGLLAFDCWPDQSDPRTF